MKPRACDTSPNPVKHLREQRSDAFARRLYQELVSVFPNILTQEVESLINLPNEGFLRRQFESSFRKECLNRRPDLLLEYFSTISGDNEIVRVADDVYLGFVSGVP